jgi:two-component system, chemotaxis family, sensor kinase CheA
VDAGKIRKALLEKFRHVCNERINILMSQFTLMAKSPYSADNADRFMREIHTLKGELKLMDFHQCGQIVHTLEDILRTLREREFYGASSFFDLFTEGLDAVAAIVVRDGHPDVDLLCKKISSFASTPTSEDPAGSPPETQPAATPATPATHPAETAPACQPTHALALSNMVRVSGEHLDRLSDLAGDLFTSYLRLREMSSSIDTILNDVQKSVVAPGKQEAHHDKSKPLGKHAITFGQQQLIRSLTQFHRTFIDRTSGMATSLDQVLDQLRELRLLPVSSLFDIYKSAARDIARERQKQIAVYTEGETALVDRSVLDALNDMLVHLVRNAVDHGFEPPEERKRIGKPNVGNLVFRAKPVGDRIWLEVEDDGRGINVEKVKQSAIKKGFITSAEANKLNAIDAMDLIFMPGLTTTETATDLSGRGVGMDVVRDKVQELGGAIHITSTPGRGTRFTIDLPTSIAIVRMLLFRSAGNLFALPATFIQQISRFSKNSFIESVGGQALVIDGHTIPATDACQLLQLGEPQRKDSALSVIVLEQGGKSIALIVDELVGEKELTIKPLGSFLTGIPCVAGATTLKDATLVLVLRTGDLISRLGRSKRSPIAVGTEMEERIRKVLLVEDSLITRELERSLLSSIGLLVEEASDGIEAMEKMNSTQFDIVVSDVEMPRMDGFDLTRQIKGDDRWSKIPVILVTTRASADYRQKGIEAGADAYVTKSDFKGKDFIETVRRLLS